MTNAISAHGLALIQEYEGFQAYPMQLSEGSWVVGYSHVRVGEPGEAMNQNEAAGLLTIDLAPVEKLVNARVTQTLTQSQFDALVSFAFSVGAEAFEKSQVLRRVNAGDFVAAACALDAWRKGEVNGELTVVGALVRRRAAEKALFLKETAPGSPSVTLRAKLDYAASVLGAPAAPARPQTVATFVEAPVAPKLELVVANDAPAALVSRDPGVRLTEILKSEPATEALLLTQIVPANDFENLEDEIVTAHAKPVARSLDAVREATRRDFEAKLATRKQKRGLQKLFSRNVSNVIEPAAPDVQADRRIRELRTQGDVKQRFELPSFDAPGAMENFGLYALLVFGLGLMGLGASLLWDGAGDLVALAGAGALAAPGVAATLMAAVGLWRQPRGSHA